jgi:hypothetical protein
MRVKRWLLLTVQGIALVVFGLLAGEVSTTLHVKIMAFSIPISTGIAVLGLLLIFVSFWRVNRSIIGALLPNQADKR